MEMGTVRFVKDDTIVSRAQPAVTIRYNNKFIYLGNLQYISQDTHRIETFIFIEPNARGHAASLLLVHFEGLLENNEGTCEDAGESVTELAGQIYQVQRRFINGPAEYSRAAGTHLSLAADYVRQRAYTLAGDMIYHRFFRVLEPDLRSTINLTYLEATDDAQTAAEEAERDPSTAQAMLERAMTSFEILA
jgi:hypothetical protein